MSETEVKIESIHFVENLVGMKIFLSPEGDPGRWLEEQGRKLVTLARGSAPIRDFHLLTALDATRPEVTREGLEVRVGANPRGGPVGYAFFQHEGTRHHIIRAKNSGALRFEINGRIVYRTSVRHPGTRPNPYLARWLEMIVR